MENDKRTVRVEVLLTKAEAEEIKTEAKREGFQMGPFMRFAAIRLARS